MLDFRRLVTAFVEWTHAHPSTVALIEDIPTEKLSKGDVGAVVHIYQGGAAFEVDFFDEREKTKAGATVPASSVLRLNLMSLSA